MQTAVANGDTRTVSFRNAHTGEELTVTFKRNGRYDEAALKQLNWFMRDWRKEQQVEMDPQLFDLVWEANRAVGGTQAIEVVCGYRSPETNAMLRQRSNGVAENSNHTRGLALDFFIPGVPLEKIREVGLRMQRGGVGFYPSSGSPFVHLDTGTIRHWPRMTYDQLAPRSSRMAALCICHRTDSHYRPMSWRSPTPNVRAAAPPHLLSLPPATLRHMTMKSGRRLPISPA